MITQQQADVMDCLKESTRDLHHEAEQHPLQQSMIRGSMSRLSYSSYLGQMLLVHGELESQIRRCADLPALKCVIKPHHFRERLLLEDLVFLNAKIDEESPLPATRAFIAELEQFASENVLSLLGFLYVLEGSTNGSKFIAKSVQRSLSLAAGCGTAYLNPHGEHQKERWAAFKADMSSLLLSQSDFDVIVEAAKSMFRAIIRISDDLATAVQAAA